jgi:trigger factor
MSQSETATPFKLTVSTPEMWQRVVQVEIETAHFEAEYAKNLRKARKAHARPGFRKGKVPMAMVEVDLGGNVRMDTLEEIVPKAYQAAVIEHKFYPVTDPVLKDLSMDEGKPVTLALEVEVRPQIEPKDYNDLPLTVRDAVLKDGVVDESLEQLRTSRAPWEVVDRKAAKGDQVKVDIVPLGENGEPDAARKTDGYQIELGDPNNFDAFDEAIIGAKAGDDVEAVISYPDDHPAEQMRGQSMTYRMAMIEVTEKVLPELNDEFASSIKDGQTMLELRVGLRDELQAEEEKRVEHENREEIVGLLIERNPVDLPPSMVKDYVDGTVEEMKQRSQMYGRVPSDEEAEAYREGAKPEAEKTMKAMFILEAIRDAEKIDVTAEDIEARIEETAAENGWPLEQYREYLKSNKEIDRLAHELAEKRTFEFLTSRAKYQEGKAGDQ